MSLKMKSMLMILLMSCAAFAGCLGSDDETESEDSTDEKPAWGGRLGSLLGVGRYQAKNLKLTSTHRK